MEFQVIKSNKLLFILLALISLNIMNVSSYVYILILFLGLFQGGFSIFNPKPLFLLILLLLGVIISLDTYYMTWCVKMILISFAAYTTLKKTDTFDKISTIIIFCSLGFAFQLFLSYFYNISIGLDTGRNYISLSTNSIMSATGFAMMLFPLIGVISTYALNIRDLSFPQIVTFVAFFLLSISVNLWLEGRSYFVILGLTFILSILYCYKCCSWSVFVKKVGLIFFVFLLSVALFLPKIIKVYEESNFYSRFNRGYDNINESSRTDLSIFYIEHMSESPFGGHNIMNLHPENQYAHNCYLDFFDGCGFVAVFFFVLLNIFCILTFYKYLKKSCHLSFFYKLLLFSTLVTINISYLVEPVLGVAQWLIEYYWFVTCLLFFYSQKQSMLYRNGII